MRFILKKSNRQTVQEHKQDLIDNGFTVINSVYTAEEVEQIITIINQTSTSSPVFRKSADLYAIRQFLQEVPVQRLLFSDKLNSLIKQLFGQDYFVTKSIYFDKPEGSNWFVSYHQDLTISVDKRIEIVGYGPWTVKQNQFAVQPPLDILENNFTIRIHLDDTDKNNGALKVVAKSHLKGIFRPGTTNRNNETETVCNVRKGGVMLMRPLLLHSSGRTTNNHKRRVIHIEFSNRQLPESLKWAEQLMNATSNGI